MNEGEPFAIVTGLFKEILARVEVLDGDFNRMSSKIGLLEQTTARLAGQMDTPRPIAERVAINEERYEGNSRAIAEIRSEQRLLADKLESNNSKILYLLLGCVGTLALSLLNLALHGLGK